MKNYILFKNLISEEKNLIFRQNSEILRKQENFVENPIFILQSNHYQEILFGRAMNFDQILASVGDTNIQ